MTLESAERLVEKILQQLEVKYEVRTGASPHHDEEHHHHDDQRRIVVAPEALGTLPPEVRPFVSTVGADGDATREEKDGK